MILIIVYFALLTMSKGFSMGIAGTEVAISASGTVYKFIFFVLSF